MDFGHAASDLAIDHAQAETGPHRKSGDAPEHAVGPVKRHRVSAPSGWRGGESASSRPGGVRHPRAPGGESGAHRARQPFASLQHLGAPWFDNVANSPVEPVRPDPPGRRGGGPRSAGGRRTGAGAGRPAAGRDRPGRAPPPRRRPEGVGARRSATRSAIVTSTSWPTADTTGTGQAAMARATSSRLKAHRSSSEPPPRPTTITSASPLRPISLDGPRHLPGGAIAPERARRGAPPASTEPAPRSPRGCPEGRRRWPRSPPPRRPGTPEARACGRDP